jgi:hypothetical protein
MERSIELINQLIALEEERDRQHKIWAIKNHKASQSVGESAMLFHLKSLKELVELEFKEKPKHIEIEIVDSSKFISQPFQTFPLTGSSSNFIPEGVLAIEVKDRYAGCTDTKYCNKCQIIYHSSICVCALWECPKCKGGITLKSNAPTENWEKVRM